MRTMCNSIFSVLFVGGGRGRGEGVRDIMLAVPPVRGIAPASADVLNVGHTEPEVEVGARGE